jgi:hypothetical protein
MKLPRKFIGKRALIFSATLVMAVGVLIGTVQYSAHAQRQYDSMVNQSDMDAQTTITASKKLAEEKKKAEQQAQPIVAAPAVASQGAPQAPATPIAPDEIKAWARTQYLSPTLSRDYEADFWRCFEYVVTNIGYRDSTFKGFNSQQHIAKVVAISKTMSPCAGGLGGGNLLLAQTLNTNCAKDANRLITPVICRWE